MIYLLYYKNLTDKEALDRVEAKSYDLACIAFARKYRTRKNLFLEKYEVVKFKQPTRVELKQSLKNVPYVERKREDKKNTQKINRRKFYNQEERVTERRNGQTNIYRGDQTSQGY